MVEDASRETGATRAVVDALFRAIGAGDIQTALSLVAERVDWGGAGDTAVPWVGMRRSREEVAEFFKLLRDNLRTDSFEITHRIFEGEHAVVIAEVDQTVVKTGRRFTGRIAFHLQVVGEKVVRHQ